MAKGGMILLVLSAVIVTSWCSKTGRVSPATKNGKRIETFASSFEKVSEQIYESDTSGKAKPVLPVMDTVELLYWFENVGTMAAYYSDIKHKPYGFFLGKKPPQNVSNVLRFDRSKGYLGPDGEFYGVKQENGESKPVKLGSIAFLVNHPDQKWKLIYAKTDKKLREIPGLRELVIFPFRYTEITPPDTSPSNIAKLNKAHLEDAADWYYDDGYYGYYENGDYDGDEYYEDGESDGLWYQYGAQNRYNGRNRYDRNGLYRLRKAYKNGFFQN